MPSVGHSYQEDEMRWCASEAFMVCFIILGFFLSERVSFHLLVTKAELSKRVFVSSTCLSTVKLT